MSCSSSDPAGSTSATFVYRSASAPAAIVHMAALGGLVVLWAHL